MRISDWSSDVCSSDLLTGVDPVIFEQIRRVGRIRVQPVRFILAGTLVPGPGPGNCRRQTADKGFGDPLPDRLQRYQPGRFDLGLPLPRHDLATCKRSAEGRVGKEGGRSMNYRR